MDSITNPAAVTIVDEDALLEAVRLVVEAVRPDRVILFGSRASLSARPDSDVDFLVVHSALDAPGADRMALYARIMDALLPCDFPIDILLMSAAEFEAFKDEPGHVAGAAARTGRSMHGQW